MHKRGSEMKLVTHILSNLCPLRIGIIVLSSGSFNRVTANVKLLKGIPGINLHISFCFVGWGKYLMSPSLVTVKDGV